MRGGGGGEREREREGGIFGFFSGGIGGRNSEDYRARCQEAVAVRQLRHKCKANVTSGKPFKVPLAGPVVPVTRMYQNCL